LVGRLIIGGVAGIAGQEGLGTVVGRAVEPVIPAPALLEEQEIETGLEAEVVLVLVEPALGRIDALRSGEALDVVRLSQDDVDPAPVGLPAGKRRRPPEILVGMVEPPVVFLLERVLLRPGVGVPVAPERLDKEVPLTVGLKLEKDVPFERLDDVDDLLVESFLIGRGKGGFPGRSCPCEGQGEEGGRQPRRASHHAWSPFIPSVPVPLK